MNNNDHPALPKESPNPYWLKNMPTPEDEEKVTSEFESWQQKLRNNQLVEKVSRLWMLFRSGKLSGFDKAVVVGALLYCISPVDITPDFIPFVGFIDDLLVVIATLAYLDGKAE